MNEDFQTIRAELGYRITADVLKDIEELNGVVVVDYAPASLYEVLVQVAAGIDLKSMIVAIAAITGVHRAYKV